MRRYTLGIGGREFVIDVQELDADRFEVAVGDAALRGHARRRRRPARGQHHARRCRRCGQRRQPSRRPRPARTRARRSAAPAATPCAAGARRGGASALNAPMPGVILELHVKAGDKVERGQQIAVLDAMKMHNFIGAPRAGTIAEVCVAAGQAVGHGDAIVRFAEG